MRGAQYLGVLVVGPIVALGALVLRRYRLALAALIVTAAKLASERVVWTFVVRSRPGTSIADAIVRGGTPTGGQSFVSGHVVLVTGLAWVVTPYLHGRWRFVPGAIAALVAFARLYLGAHAPLDVLGGAALGDGHRGRGEPRRRRAAAGLGRTHAVTGTTASPGASWRGSIRTHPGDRWSSSRRGAVACAGWSARSS